MHPAYSYPPPIPSGARRPEIPSPSSAWTPYADQFANAPADFLPNGYGPGTSYYPSSAPLPAYSQPYLSPNGSQRPRTTSAYEPETASFAFPEPSLYRSSSSQPSPAALRPLGHRSSKSDSGVSPPPSHLQGRISPQPSVTSFESGSAELSQDELEDLSKLSLESEEGLRLFQSGRVPEKEEEWHRFVPQGALEAVGKHEVERQSVLFEVIKSEKDYVADLELVKEVYIDRLRNEKPEVIPKDRRSGFIQQVFGNIERILSHHQRMLGSLFSRQFDQHPLVQSIADIILDNALLFMPEYETYMKNAPISLEWHRKELKRNPAYEGFLQRCAQDPRARKRDIKTLLSRPVTRLPRLRLLLERVEKVTEPEHPDIEQLPLILSVLSNFIKSTEPGIVVAESKVKFWGICESLVYSRGEIIDLDLYDDSRTLVYSSALSRRQRSDNWSSWTDLMGVLLDSYFLLLREDNRNGVVKRQVTSRPIPLEYMRLVSFDDPPEARRERGDSIIASLSSAKQELYPFTFYHAGARNTRRYTLYAPSPGMRKKWHDALVDAIGIRKIQQESNRWFAQQQLNDGFFRVVSVRLTFRPGTKITGRVCCAVAFWNNGRSFLAVGCASGIYVGLRADSSFRKVLPFVSPTSMAVLQDLNKFIVHHESSLMSYSLDLLARVAQGQSTQQNLEGSLERLASNDGNVLFFRAGRLSERSIVVYASKSFMQVTLHALEATSATDTSLTPKRTRSGHISYRSFGSPCYVPRDAYDITFLPKSVAICTDKGIVIVNPTNLSTGSARVVPDFSDAYGNSPMAALKSRCESCKVLGLVRVDASELMVIYDEMACYITKHGNPSRSSGYVRWESTVLAYTQRGTHILLFSPEFVEVRSIQTGRLVQVIEGRDVRLLQRGLGEDDKEMLIVGMRGEHDDKTGVSEKLVELVQTSEIRKPEPTPPMKGASQAMWDEWDMGFG